MVRCRSSALARLPCRIPCKTAAGRSRRVRSAAFVFADSISFCRKCWVALRFRAHEVLLYRGKTFAELSGLCHRVLANRCRRVRYEGKKQWRSWLCCQLRLTTDRARGGGIGRAIAVQLIHDMPGRFRLCLSSFPRTGIFSPKSPQPDATQARCSWWPVADHPPLLFRRSHARA